MSKVPYTKPALSYADQLQQVKSRGLIIPDENEFLRLLELKSYYRYILAHSFGAFWHTNPALFSDNALQIKTIDKVKEEFRRSDASFIRSFKKKYSDPIPPCWTAFEVISFGSLSMLFDNLKPGRSKREVANWFGLDDKTFGSWLHSLVYVRNVCAHHSRLWNRELRIQPKYPISPASQWLNNLRIDNHKIYYVLSMLLYLLQFLDNGHSLTVDFKQLLQKYPNIDPAAMGFPEGWETEPLWRELA